MDTQVQIDIVLLVQRTQMMDHRINSAMYVIYVPLNVSPSTETGDHTR